MNKKIEGQPDFDPGIDPEKIKREKRRQTKSDHSSNNDEGSQIDPEIQAQYEKDLAARFGAPEKNEENQEDLDSILEKANDCLEDIALLEEEINGDIDTFTSHASDAVHLMKKIEGSDDVSQRRTLLEHLISVKDQLEKFLKNKREQKEREEQEKNKQEKDEALQEKNKQEINQVYEKIADQNDLVNRMLQSEKEDNEEDQDSSDRVTSEEIYEDTIEAYKTEIKQVQEKLDAYIEKEKEQKEESNKRLRRIRHSRDSLKEDVDSFRSKDKENVKIFELIEACKKLIDDISKNVRRGIKKENIDKAMEVAKRRRVELGKIAQSLAENEKIDDQEKRNTSVNIKKLKENVQKILSDIKAIDKKNEKYHEQKEEVKRFKKLRKQKENELEELENKLNKYIEDNSSTKSNLDNENIETEPESDSENTSERDSDSDDSKHRISQDEYAKLIDGLDGEEIIKPKKERVTKQYKKNQEAINEIFGNEEEFEHIIEDYNNDDQKILLEQLLERADNDEILKEKIQNQLDDLEKEFEEELTKDRKSVRLTVQAHKHNEVINEAQRKKREENASNKSEEDNDFSSKEGKVNGVEDFDSHEEEYEFILKNYSGKDGQEKMLENLFLRLKEDETELFSKIDHRLQMIQALKNNNDKVLEVKEVSDKVAEQYAEFGIGKEDLETEIEGFCALSEAQQLLALENLKQVSLGKIKERAQKDQREEMKNSKFFKRIWKGIIKSYSIATKEKENAEEIFKGGLKEHKEILAQITKGLNNFGPEVKERDGKLEMQFLTVKGDLLKPQQDTIDNFNDIAAQYARIPDEWQYKDTASKKEYKTFQNLKEQYGEAKYNAFVLKTKFENKKEASLSMNEIERQIAVNRFLNTHPEVEKALGKIKDQNVLKTVISNVATERGLYAAGGFITRSVTASMIGLAATPVASSVLGGYIGRQRAKRDLKVEEKLARRGESKNVKDIKRYSEVEKVKDKILKLQSKLEEEGLSPRRRRAFERALNVNTAWIDDKVRSGLIDYGDEKERITRQYELMGVIAQAQVKRAEFQGFEKFKERKVEDEEEETEQEKNTKKAKQIESFEELAKRFNLAIAKRDSKAEKKRKSHLLEQTLKGAAISAGFATAGYLIRDYFSDDISALKGRPSGGVGPEETGQEVPPPSPERVSGPGGKNLGDVNERRTAIDHPKSEVKIAPNQAETGAHKAVEQVAKPEVVFERIDGDVNTTSEAVYNILKDKNTADSVKLSFIKRHLGEEAELSPENIKRAVRKLSVANMDADVQNDEINLVHKGDMVYIKENGEVGVEPLSGQKAAKVSELQLRENWADQEGAKYGLKPDEVEFYSKDDLSIKAFETNIDVNGETWKVVVDQDGNFITGDDGYILENNFRNLPGENKFEQLKDYIESNLEGRNDAVAQVGEHGYMITNETDIRDGIYDRLPNSDHINKTDFETTRYPAIRKCLAQMDVSVHERFGETEWEKVEYLLKHENDIEGALEKYDVIKGANISLEEGYDYHEQLKTFKGDVNRLEGIVGFLKHSDQNGIRESLSKILARNIGDKEIVLNKDGSYMIKDLEKGFDFIIQKKDGTPTFAIEGPSGQWSFNEGRRVWHLFGDLKPGTPLTSETLEKGLRALRKMSLYIENR